MPLDGAPETQAREGEMQTREGAMLSLTHVSIRRSLQRAFLAFPRPAPFPRWHASAAFSRPAPFPRWHASPAFSRPALPRLHFPLPCLHFPLPRLRFRCPVQRHPQPPVPFPPMTHPFGPPVPMPGASAFPFGSTPEWPPSGPPLS